MIIIAAILLGVFVGVAIRGPSWGFRTLYVPITMLVPYNLLVEVPVFPDLTAARAAGVALVVSALLTGTGNRLLPRWRWFDLLAFGAVSSFAVSFGIDRGLRAFSSEFFTLTLDWLLPYLFARAFLVDAKALRVALRPFAISSVTLAVLSVMEARMAYRYIVEFWNLFGAGLQRPAYFGNWRWGLLRSFAAFQHPIVLGSFFAFAAPLMILYGQLNPRHWKQAQLAALACFAGCLSGLSRGPILALIGTAALMTVLGRRMRFAMAIGALGVAITAPFVISSMQQVVSETQRDLETKGNTASDRYRVALVMIYASRISDVGFFGRPEVVGEDYEKAHSLDNGYLFLFITGGWIGGGLFVVMTVYLVGGGLLAVSRARGRPRRALASAVASYVALATCMANVWFAPDFAIYYWIASGMVLNVARPIPVRRSRRGSFAARRELEDRRAKADAEVSGAPAGQPA